MTFAPLGAASLASAPFGLKLLIGLAAVDDGLEVRDLPIVGDLAFGSAHGIPPLRAALTASSGRDKHSLVSALRFTAGDKNFCISGH